MFSLIFLMFTFALSMSISPGPVNITILSSSMNYGLRSTFAFISGATIGFTALLAAVCFGLYQVISLYPILLNIITVLGTVLLVWMGWNIARAQGDSIQTNQLELPKAPTFMQGVLLQWLNPKAWIAAVSGTALFSASHNAFYLLLFILIYFVVCYLSLLVWGYAGQKLAVFLNQGSRMGLLNMAMGVLLMFIALQMSWSHFYA